MKVLHVEAGRHLYGGAMQVVFLLRGLAGSGVENVLVCPTGSAVAEAVAGEALEARVRTLTLGGDLDLAAVFRLRRVLREEQPDIVHLHSRRGADTFGALAALGHPARVILSRRVDNPESALSVALKYPLYDHVIAISSAIAELLVREGVRPEKITMVHDAVDPERWQKPASRAQLEQEFSLHPGAPVICMAAQFIPRKGHELLLQALPAVIAHHPDLQVLLFGKGPQQEHIQQRVAATGLARNVMFAGFRDDLPRWFGAMDALVHPAAREGLGVALLQAACAGLPIVACDAGGIGEVVLDERTGFLVPVGDATLLAKALLRVLGDPPLAAHLAAGAQAHVARGFSIDAMARAHLKVYRTLVGEQRAGVVSP